MPKLSVMYIVRNEESHIATSLASVQTIADEIVIVDTGSRDGTVQACRRLDKVRVFGHPWQHNFSQARNYGIKQCTGDWILYLDADERLEVKSANQIKQAVDTAGRNVTGMAVTIVDCDDWAVPPNAATSFFEDTQVRLFRRINGIIFEGRVQETVAIKASEVGGIDQIDARICHHIWHGKGQEYANSRLAYYRKLGSGMETTGEAKARVKVSGRVGIVVPVFNKSNLTKECVGSICAHTTIPYVLCPVDNGSVDDTNAYLTTILGHPPLRFDKNMGVPKAKNAGMEDLLKDESVEYICFVDNDAVVHPGWLEGMVAVLDSNPNMGAVGPLCLTGMGVQAISGKDFSSLRWTLPCRNPDHILVNSVGGFCMLVRAKIARQVGLFEESFGMYGQDDLDYCMRIRRAGYDIGVANRVMVDHKGRGTIIGSGIDLHNANLVSTNRFSQKWKVLPYNEEAARPQTPLREHQSDAPQKISIVVIAHNRIDVTSQCLNSVMDNTSNFELIVVDNGSTDGTKDWVRMRIPGVKLIENSKNMGVPTARNQGIEQTTGEYVVLMDNDVIVRAGWAEEMLARIRNGADCVGLEAWQLDDNFGASKKCVGDNERFDYLGGACTMFRRAVYEKIGLLDEGFSPAYYEDVDISVRAKKAGFSLSWLNTQRIVHLGHSTLIHGQKDFSYGEVLGKSHERFAKKMRGQISVTHKPLPKVSRRLKIMYLGMEWNYGNRGQGLSFEHDNFFPAFQQWNKTKEMFHFDFVDIGQQIGVEAMSNRLVDTVNQFCPDAIFGVWFNEQSDPRRSALQAIRDKTPTKVISWFCDSHFRYENFDKGWADSSDYCVTTSTSGYQKYLRDGLALKVIKSQWGASPKYKKIEGMPRDVDVSFVGQPHGDRRQVIDQIRRAGINIQTFGTGWDRRLSFEEMNEMFNRSKINLNLNNACDVRFKQIKGRNFEVPGCGGFLLTETAENLDDYYKYGEEIGVYNGVGDMIDKLRHYLRNDAERDAIADAGYKRTMKEHTYATRFDHIFSKAGLL